MNFMVAPCISNIKHFVVQQTHTNYKILRLLKWLKISKLFQHVSVHIEPSSGSQNQCVAKITYLVPMCVSLLMLSVLWRHVPAKERVPETKNLQQQ